MASKELVSSVREEEAILGKVLLRSKVAGGHGNRVGEIRDKSPCAKISILSEEYTQIVLGHPVPSNEHLLCIFVFSILFVVIAHDQGRQLWSGHWLGVCLWLWCLLGLR